MEIAQWFSAVLETTYGLFSWFLSILVLYAPVATAGGVILAASTYRLKSRVEQSDQWWKRVEYALGLRNCRDQDDQEIGYKILQAVIPEKPEDDASFGNRLTIWRRNGKRWKIRDGETDIIRGILADRVIEVFGEVLLPELGTAIK